MILNDLNVPCVIDDLMWLAVATGLVQRDEKEHRENAEFFEDPDYWKWEVRDYSGPPLNMYDIQPRFSDDDTHVLVDGKEQAELIATMHNVLPALLDVVDAARWWVKVEYTPYNTGNEALHQKEDADKALTDAVLRLVKSK